MRLGLVRSRSGRWLWEDGSEPAYTNWLQTPPPPDRRPLCAVIDGRRGGWVTQDCGNTVPFYCEAVPGQLYMIRDVGVSCSAELVEILVNESYTPSNKA